MFTLLKIFLVFVSIVFVLGFLARIFMHRVFKKMQDRTNQHFRYKDRSQSHYKQKEGTVTLNDKKRKEKKKFDKGDGEYIDYEEVDE